MEDAQHETPAILAKRVELPRNAAIAAIAEGQHDVVALCQLTELGIGASAVRERAATGQLHRVHRGVYTVGTRRLTREGIWMAAVLACGPKAVLSHRSAAALWGIGRDASTKTDVSLPSRSVRKRRGIEVHAAASLTDADITECEGIPCTTVARTLVDLGAVVRRRDVERAINEAELLRLFDRRAVEEALDRASGLRGAGVARAVLASRMGPTLTASQLEERFLALCREAEVETPRVNSWVLLEEGAMKVDFLWWDQRLVVETDGRETHGTAAAFERDRERDRRLVLAGYRVVRFTWRQVTSEPELVARALRDLTAR